MLHLSMNQLSTLRWPFERDVHEYASAGFQSMGIWRPKLSDVSEDRGVRLLREYGMEVSNLLWAGGFTGSDGRSYRDAVRDAIDAIHTASHLETECLIIYTGSWGGHTQSHAYRLVRNALTELLPHAEEFGITLALEPMSPACGAEWTFLSSLQEALDIIDPFESPYLKLALDTYHFAIDGPPALQHLEDIVDRIAVVHLGDGLDPPVGEQNRCRLGDGRIPLQKIVATLKSSGYDGFLDVELMGESLEGLDYQDLLQHSRHALEEIVTAPS